jgi:hypothetical protein
MQFRLSENSKSNRIKVCTLPLANPLIDLKLRAVLNVASTELREELLFLQELVE